jgi:hypothetical protein
VLSLRSKKVVVAAAVNAAKEEALKGVAVHLDSPVIEVYPASEAVVVGVNATSAVVRAIETAEVQVATGSREATREEVSKSCLKFLKK